MEAPELREGCGGLHIVMQLGSQMKRAAMQLVALLTKSVGLNACVSECALDRNPYPSPERHPAAATAPVTVVPMAAAATAPTAHSAAAAVTDILNIAIIELWGLSV